MKQIIGFALLLATTIGLSACTSMSPEECRAADWQQIGYFDAIGGREKSRLDNHRKACAEAAIVPDLAAYLEGYRLGLPEFCTKAQGFVLGKSNRALPIQCDLPEFMGFRDGFNLGREAWQLRYEAQQLERQAKEAKQTVDDLSAQITANDQRLQDATLTQDQRDQINRTNRALQAVIAEKRSSEAVKRHGADKLREQAEAIRL